MAGYLDLIATQFGIPIPLFIIFLVWSAVWKLLALWKAGRNNSPVWFIVLALANTFGILEIFYIFVFPQINFKKIGQPVKRKRRR